MAHLDLEVVATAWSCMSTEDYVLFGPRGITKVQGRVSIYRDYKGSVLYRATVWGESLGIVQGP